MHRCFQRLAILTMAKVLLSETCAGMLAGAAAAKGLPPIPPFAYASEAEDPSRPQLRFSPRLGWANDPCGLSWRDGEWHLFHQHNPTSVEWGDMHWNHAVSKDLLHWRELGDALCPDALGDIWSGSAVTDADNTAGFGRGAHVLLYSAFCKVPPTQCLAYSLDGRRYEKYAGNPVVPTIDGQNRDPKVFWHKPTGKWVMALYGVEKERNVIRILTSSDLRRWEHKSDYVGSEFSERKKTFWLCECPGLEELAIEGEAGRTAWVAWGGGTDYAVGMFDGERFVPAEERICGFRGCSYYAAQTFSGDPLGRSLWLAWFKLPKFEGASYRHAFSLPQELSLRRTDKGLRLVRRPARELKALRSGPAVAWEASRVELVELDLSVRLEAGAVLDMSIRGVPVRYSEREHQLCVGKESVQWSAEDGVLALKMYVDRVGFEVFSRDGLQMAAFGSAVPEHGNLRLKPPTAPGIVVLEARAHPLVSIWERSPGKSDRAPAGQRQLEHRHDQRDVWLSRGEFPQEGLPHAGRPDDGRVQIEQGNSEKTHNPNHK